VTLYRQTLGAGYSAPGLTTLTDTDNFGGTFTMPITERLSVKAKGDQRTQLQGCRRPRRSSTSATSSTARGA
jgi:hypothetical protein